MTKTAKELIEKEIKEAELSYKMNDRRSGDYIAGTLKGLNIALAHIQNATTLVTSEETVTINKEVYDLLIKKIAEQVEENESKKLLLESEITHLEEVLKHGVSSRFAEENAIYIYSPKTGHEIRKKLEDDYKLMHSKLSVPKKIAEQADKTDFDELFQWGQEEFYQWFDHEHDKYKEVIYAYLAGKALGVDLVEVTDD